MNELVKGYLTMRHSLKELIHSTILFKYSLPNKVNGIAKSIISSDDDVCYSPQSNNDLSEIIYNAVIDYAFNEYEIIEQDFDSLHRRALTRKLKFNKDAIAVTSAIKNIVILYCVLHIFHQAPPVIARGHLYNILENGETKGYDAYHLISTKNQLELWFGEVKFYANFGAATTGENGAITNLSKAISDNYFNNNLIAISERINDLAIDDSLLKPVLEDIRSNPDLKISELSEKHNIKLVYPILILFNSKKTGFDQTIRDSIAHIKKEVKKIDFDISVEVSLFFIFIPVSDAREIKSKVMKWISEKKPLML